MDFISTRGAKAVTASQAILKGIADDGGLFVPSSFPVFAEDELDELRQMSYPERVAKIVGKYLTDYTAEELLDYCEKAYAKFDGDPAPLVEADEGFYLLELFHGRTAAFKDMALSLLPYLLTAAKRKNGDVTETLILVATSGDTGKAALEGFKDVDGCKIIVFYPSEGVSRLQKLQMQSSEGANVRVLGINGNFDDAQSAVKRIFNSPEMNAKLYTMGYTLSSANSINFGRLVPQIAYYVSAYLDLVTAGRIEDGDLINFAVPSGNFGNILAAYYAKRMGLPINKLIVASNLNNVLTDFFNSGKYDINREFYKTQSPSMDILISSNLERLLFEFVGRKPDKLNALMTSLKEGSAFEVNPDEFLDAFPEFDAYSADENETANTIDNFFSDYDYLLDPHTAVGVACYYKYCADSEDETPTVVVATASPYKFAQDVYFAAAHKKEDDPFKAVKKLNSFSGFDIPQSLAALEHAAVIHDEVIDKTEIEQKLLEIMN